MSQEGEGIGREISELKVEIGREIGELKIDFAKIGTSLENALEKIASTQRNSERIVELEKIDSRQQGQLNLLRGIGIIIVPLLLSFGIFLVQQITELRINYEILSEHIKQLEETSKYEK